jgi:uncharacterized damage-inducible protein DinB
MNVEYFRTLFDYSAWANGKLWQAAQNLSDEQWAHDPGYSVGGVGAQFVHMLGAEQIWLARLHGDSLAFPTLADFPTRESLRAAWDGCESAWHEYLAFADDNALLQIAHYERRGKQESRPIWQGLAQLVNHGTDHRAQVLFLLHQHGAPTFEQDLIAFYRERFG